MQFMLIMPVGVRLIKELLMLTSGYTKFSFFRILQAALRRTTSTDTQK